MFCLHHSGLLFVLLHNTRFGKRQQFWFPFPVRSPFFCSQLGLPAEAVRIELLHGSPLLWEEKGCRSWEAELLQPMSLHIWQPMLPSSSLSLICFLSSLTSHSPASAWLSCGCSYFCLHQEVISYVASRRDTAFFCDFRQLLGNKDFLPSFQLEAKVRESNNEAQCCSSIF